MRVPRCIRRTETEIGLVQAFAISQLLRHSPPIQSVRGAARRCDRRHRRALGAFFNDQERNAMFFTKIPQLVVDPFDHHWGQAERGLVHKQQFGACKESAADGELLLLTPGQFCCPHRSPLAEYRELLVDAR